MSLTCNLCGRTNGRAPSTVSWPWSLWGKGGWLTVLVIDEHGHRLALCHKCLRTLLHIPLAYADMEP